MLLNKEKTGIDELDAMVLTRVNELSLLHTLSLSSREGWANCSLQAKLSIACFIHKVLLEHNHTCWIIILNCFFTAMAELDSCNRDPIACKSQNIYYLVLYRKSSLACNRERFYKVQDQIVKFLGDLNRKEIC